MDVDLYTFLPTISVFGLSAIAFISAPRSTVPSKKKPFNTFSEFYPFYLSQHDRLFTKLLHAVGTSFVVVTAIREPKLIASLTAAAISGYSIFPWLRGYDSGIIEFIVSIGAFSIVGKNLGVSDSTLLSIPAFAYSFAWISHFAWERNTPATFIYPSFSLIGDFRMFADLCVGRNWRFDKP
jgi:hypothetical protein